MLPLLLQIGTLLVNHIELARDSEKSAAIIAEAKALFVRVKEESGDMALIKQAVFMEALCALASGDSNSVLDLLDGSVTGALPPESLLASAYHMKGNILDAKGVLQIGIYQNLVVLFNFFPAYLMLCADDAGKYDETLRRALTVAEAFDMKNLHPGVIIGTYLTAAQGYMTQGTGTGRGYAAAVYRNRHGRYLPLRLHNDAFFDLLEDRLDKIDIGTDLPRATIRRSERAWRRPSPGIRCLRRYPRAALSEHHGETVWI